MIAIIDYDAGNIRSVEKAFAAIGEQTVLTRDEKLIREADKVVLPGVGVFGDAAKKIRDYGLENVVKETAGSGKPFLAICVGLQLLFDESEESPGAKGLSIMKGKILRIPDDRGLTVPQIGWNSLHKTRESRLLKGIDEGAFVYFVHSYYLKAEEAEVVTATVDYGVEIHAAVERGNVFATQFHPEKSSKTGLKILKNFCEI
ncbi:MAG: imidazole glycerol phosphate synthase subunit HisH [Lachnospiraceae bacterium]|nr:imidazole glycerol phosphate synthase subunit HisH [Lachnospiraceae bacterium]